VEGKIKIGEGTPKKKEGRPSVKGLVEKERSFSGNPKNKNEKKREVESSEQGCVL